MYEPEAGSVAGSAERRISVRSVGSAVPCFPRSAWELHNIFPGEREVYNQRFSVYEDALCSPYLTFGGIKGMRGVG